MKKSIILVLLLVVLLLLIAMRFLKPLGGGNESPSSTTSVENTAIEAVKDEPVSMPVIESKPDPVLETATVSAPPTEMPIATPAPVVPTMVVEEETEIIEDSGVTDVGTIGF